MKTKKKILILYSDAGGGHRSAAISLQVELNKKYGQDCTVELIDVLREYAPKPLSSIPKLYSQMAKTPKAWELTYKVWDGKSQSELFLKGMWRYSREAIERLMAEHPADVIVSVFHGANPVVKSLPPRPRQPKFVTVVTDLMTIHPIWFDTAVDLCIVPTAQAYDKARHYGLKSDQLKIIGLPVNPKFTKSYQRKALRAELGWSQDLPIVLVMTGGDGVARVAPLLQQMQDMALDVGVAVICGRNTRLKNRIARARWQMPVFAYGFVENVEKMMQASDILVSKAGPGTIAEAMVSGLPIILYSYLYQEHGNVAYVVDNGVGAWAASPRDIVMIVSDWLAQPAALKEMSKAAKQLGFADSAEKIADTIMKL